MKQRLPVRKMRIGPPRRGLVIDEAYLAFIRKLPCIVCGAVRYVEAAHVGARGLGQKCSDREALPMCPAHHRTGPDAYHVLGGKSFWKVWGLDRFRLIEEHNRQYEELKNRTRAITAQEKSNDHAENQSRVRRAG